MITYRIANRRMATYCGQSIKPKTLVINSGALTAKIPVSDDVEAIALLEQWMYGQSLLEEGSC